MKLYLGIIKNEKGDLINHRSLLKILLNPFLNMFGCIVVSNFDLKTQKFLNYTIIYSKDPILKRFKETYMYGFSKEIEEGKFSVINERKLW